MKRNVIIAVLCILFLLAAINVYFISNSPMSIGTKTYDYSGGWPVPREVYEEHSEEELSLETVMYPEITNGLFALSIIFIGVLIYCLFEKVFIRKKATRQTDRPNAA